MSEYETRTTKLAQWQQAEQTPFAHTFDKQWSCSAIHDHYKSVSRETPTTDLVTTAGRLMAKRGHGKAAFATIQDVSDSIQIYFNVTTIGQSTFDQCMSLDIGDIIGVTGIPFMTKRGELTLHIQTLQLLTKSLTPLPEKYHGLQDKELRYRHRYVDLIMNRDVQAVFTCRSAITRQIRDFLHRQHFMEVETPVLHTLYGGAAALPFMTHHNQLDQDLYLRIALELHLKRLIVGGYEKIFEIGRVFRNEGTSYKHNPEYTLLELYQAYADYTDMMALTETMIRDLVQSQTGSTTLVYQETTIDVSKPFQRLTMTQALADYAGITHINRDTLIAALKHHAVPITGNETIGHLMGLVYDKCVEPKLTGPVFIMDYPWELSPLAKRHRDNPDLVERFELIIGGMELANAFSELNDPIEQQARFDDQQQARQQGDQEAHQMDHDYINALRYGMPPTGGLGIGIDRLVMLLTNQPSIRDVLFFPHLKPK